MRDAGGHAFEGMLEGVTGGVATGWARDRSRPDTAVAVEILCDDHAVALDHAEVFRPDLRLQDVEAACCGFQIRLPGAVLEHGRWLTARVANTDFALGGRMRLGDGPADVPRPAIIGEVFGGDSLRLTGWVNPAGFRMRAVTVRASVDGASVAEAVAGQALPGQARSDPLARGFTLDLPMALADGVVRELRVTDDGGRELRGSPVRLLVHGDGLAGLIRRIAATAAAEAGTGLAADLELARRLARTLDHHRPGFARFEDLEAWVAANPPPAARPRPGFPCVILYGEGDAAATRASLGSAVARVIEAPGGGLSRADLPAAGAVALIRAGDRMERHGLDQLAAALDGAEIAYSDTLQEIGGRTSPWFKPGWDPDLFLAQGYVFGALAVDAALLRSALPAERGAEDAADLSTMVVAAAARAEHVRHLPLPLIRSTAGAEGEAPVPPGWDAALTAQWPCLAEGRAERIPDPARPWLARLSWRVPDTPPRVSVLIPTRDRVDLLARAVESLIEITDYPAFEVAILDNGSEETETLDYLAGLSAWGVRVIPCPGPFNFAAINNRGVAETSGEMLCLLNNDVEITDPGWLAAMVGQLVRPGIGAVGAKLLWDTGMVQHGGVVLGMHGGADHAGPIWAADDPGYCGANQVARRVSAVTAACLLVRRADYLAVGGMDEAAFPVNFNDVDLCLKLRARGLGVVWTPEATLLHHESASRGRDLLPARAARARRELEALRQRWPDALADDPFYSPNLTRRGEAYAGLALPPGPRGPR